MNSKLAHLSSYLLGASALAVSSLAAAATAPAGATGAAVGAADAVHCYEVNSCKGHGFKAMDAKSCLMKGGVIGDL